MFREKFNEFFFEIIFKKCGKKGMIHWSLNSGVSYPLSAFQRWKKVGESISTGSVNLFIVTGKVTLSLCWEPPCLVNNINTSPSNYNSSMARTLFVIYLLTALIMFCCVLYIPSQWIYGIMFSKWSVKHNLF